MKKIGALLMALLLLVSGEALAAKATKQEIVENQGEYQTELIMTSDYQWAGLAVTSDQRLFVSYPRWDDYPEFHIAQIIDRVEQPFATEIDFVSVRSLAVDKNDVLWAVDDGQATGRPAVPSRLFQINSDTGELIKVYEFPPSVVRANSRLANVRVDVAAGRAYLTDIGEGGIIVLDINTGESYRALTDIPEVKQNIQAIYLPRTGLYNKLGNTSAIELFDNDRIVVFSSLGGDTVYSLPVNILCDRTLDMKEKRKRLFVESLYGTPTVSFARRGDVFYMGDLSDEGLWTVEARVTVRKGALFNVGIDLPWVDALATDKYGSLLYITSLYNYPLEERETMKYAMYRTFWDTRSKGY